MRWTGSRRSPTSNGQARVPHARPMPGRGAAARKSAQRVTDQEFDTEDSLPDDPLHRPHPRLPDPRLGLRRALAIQVFFAGMYVFVGASNIELHRNMAHVIGALTILLLAAPSSVACPRSASCSPSSACSSCRACSSTSTSGSASPMIAALHPVNALVLTYAALTLAKRSSAYWKTDALNDRGRRSPRRRTHLVRFRGAKVTAKKAFESASGSPAACTR